MEPTNQTVIVIILFAAIGVVNITGALLAYLKMKYKWAMCFSWVFGICVGVILSTFF